MNTANLALEEDPRDPVNPMAVSHNQEIPIETRLLHAAHDASVSFEEYAYYASITRAEEKAENQKYVAAAGPKSVKTVLKNRFTNYKAPTALETSEPDSPGEMTADGLGEKDAVSRLEHNGALNTSPHPVSDAEYKNASRAIRTAGWSSVFYLVTTDILGPFSTPSVYPSKLYYIQTDKRLDGRSLRWAMVPEWHSTLSLGSSHCTPDGNFTKSSSIWILIDIQC